MGRTGIPEFTPPLSPNGRERSLRASAPTPWFNTQTSPPPSCLSPGEKTESQVGMAAALLKFSEANQMFIVSMLTASTTIFQRVRAIRFDSITNGKFRLIRNLLPNELYIEKHLMGGGRLNNPYWATWMGDDPMKKPNSYASIKRYMSRPPRSALQYTRRSLRDEESRHGRWLCRGQKHNSPAALDEWMRGRGRSGSQSRYCRGTAGVTKGRALVWEVGVRINVPHRIPAVSDRAGLARHKLSRQPRSDRSRADLCFDKVASRSLLRVRREQRSRSRSVPLPS